MPEEKQKSALEKSNNSLLPCPFCGGEAEININMPYTPHLFYVKCPKCIIHIGHFDTEEMAINAWNARHQSLNQASQEDRDMLELFLRKWYDRNMFNTEKLSNVMYAGLVQSILKEYVLVSREK